MSLKTISAADLAAKLTRLHKAGLPRGELTGWPVVDKHYTVVPGQVTVITGVPGHGKSEWIDALTSNLSLCGWKFVYFSPENQPHELHLAKICEKLAKKNFRKLDSEELQITTGIIDMSFKFIAMDDEFAISPSVKQVIEKSSESFGEWIRAGDEKLGLIIDPWNELDHGRAPNVTETEYISQTLSVIRQFARDWNVHVWIVAHPAKMYKDKEGNYPVPTPYDIAGSAHWRNKADNCITIFRDLSVPGTVDVHIQKVRFKHVGHPGSVSLAYNNANGCYEDFSRAYEGEEVSL